MAMLAWLIESAFKIDLASEIVSIEFAGDCRTDQLGCFQFVDPRKRDGLDLDPATIETAARAKLGGAILVSRIVQEDGVGASFDVESRAQSPRFLREHPGELVNGRNGGDNPSAVLVKHLLGLLKKRESYQGGAMRA